MRRYLAWFALTFLLGAALLVAFNVVMDPYGMRSGPHPALGQERIALRADYRLAKLARFARSPAPNIILGDSRSESLGDSLFSRHGARYVNMAFGGGTAYEAIDAFWFAARRERLQTVVLGLPFNLYAERNDMNLVPPAQFLVDHPLAYFTNLSVLRVGMKAVVGALTGRRFDDETPPMTREAFWRYELDEGTSGQYRNWRRPVVLRRKLQSVIDYCRTNGIRVYIFVPPTHVDLQRRVHDFGLTAEYAAYKRELAAMGVPVFDFDVPNDFTADRANFSDPYHVAPAARVRVVEAMYASGLRP